MNYELRIRFILPGVVKRILKYKLLLSWLFISFQADAQNTAATATFDTNAMLIGDQVTLKLQVTAPPQAQILWPAIPDTILENIQVLDRGKIDTITSADKTTTTYSQNILLTTFDTGFYTIPPIAFYYRIPPDTDLLVTETRMHFLAAHTVAVDTLKPIKPIKGPIKVPLTFREILPWILLGLAGAAIVGLFIYYLKKRKKKEPLFRLKPRVILKPHEIALSGLEKLRVKKLWQQGRVKEYYTELTDILRKYIEDRFHIPALERTTAEILDTLREFPEVPHETCQGLEKDLMLADMVKFAREKPTSNQNEQSLEQGIWFVNQTVYTPSPEIIPEKG